MLAIEIVLASLSQQEREELAQALTEWMTDGRPCEHASDQALNGALTDALERRGIDPDHHDLNDPGPFAEGNAFEEVA